MEMTFFFSFIFFSFKFYFLLQINLFFQFRAFSPLFFICQTFDPDFVFVVMCQVGEAWAGHTLMIDSRCHTSLQVKNEHLSWRWPLLLHGMLLANK